MPSLELRDLRAALAKLSLETREVILLVGLEGMDYESAANVLSVPIGTVRSRLSRGRAELRKLMGFVEQPVRPWRRTHLRMAAKCSPAQPEENAAGVKSSPRIDAGGHHCRERRLV